MRPHRGARAALACAVLVALGAGVAGCGADTEPEAPPTTAQPAPGPAPRPDVPATPSAGTPKLKGPLAFHVRHRTQLRTRPGGRVVATITTRTEFKSPRILAVAARKPGWVLVRTSVRRHHVGWLPLKAGALFSEPRTLVIDLSKRSLTVFHRGRRTDVFRVAIGTAATPTPRGTFAITDRLTVKPGTPYGCCILALTAHQPKIAQGWGGGDRVAIHATPDTSALGKRVSHGCIRGSNRALRRLMRQMRLGAPVTIHA
jgi:lipoprotein-anchoring transpeptidase ErfK/SrfK